MNPETQNAPEKSRKTASAGFIRKGVCTMATLLEKTRKINRLLQRSVSVEYDGIARVLSNVLVGDVWLLSGQSNIDVTIERVYPWYTKDIDSYSNDRIRLFRVQNETDTHGPKTDIRPTGINWKPLSKQNAWLFSAVGYFLGREMFGKNGVPQGIIVNSWGGTPIEAWISADSLQRDYPMLVEKTRLYQDDDYVQAQARANQLADRRWNAMLNEKETFLKVEQKSRKANRNP